MVVYIWVHDHKYFQMYSIKCSVLKNKGKCLNKKINRKYLLDEKPVMLFYAVGQKNARGPEDDKVSLQNCLQIPNPA